jgi:hypothetical protein
VIDTGDHRLSIGEISLISTNDPFQPLLVPLLRRAAGVGASLPFPLTPAEVG